MIIHTDHIKDKVEFFEAKTIDELEKSIAKKIEDNKAILLEVHHVSHQVNFDPKSGQKLYSAVIHFKSN